MGWLRWGQQVVRTEEGQATVEGRCLLGAHPYTLTVPADGLFRWASGGVAIQQALPRVPAGEREFLLSGTCPACFDRAFRTEDDDA